MSLAAGARLGPYAIISALGGGGMGSACGRGERAQRDEPPRAGVGPMRGSRAWDPVGPREHLEEDEGDFAQWPW